MKRRSFLAMLGLAPVAAIPAVSAVSARASACIPVSELDPNTIIEFRDGVLRLGTANINEITAGKIRSADCKFALDTGAGTMTWQS